MNLSSLLTVTSLGNKKFASDYDFSRSDLKLYLFCFTIGGSAVLIYEGKEYQLNKGSLFFIDCTKPHRYYANNSQWEMCWIHCSSNDIMAEYYNLLTNMGKKVYFFFPEFLTDVYNNIKELSLDYSEINKIRTSLYVNNLLQQLCILSYESIPDEFKEIADYVKHNYSQKINLEMLSSLIHLSKYYFLRKFKQYYKVTPYEYIKICRNEKSKDMLSNTCKSIDEISSEIGFSSTANFCKSFKLMNQMTPYNYRTYKQQLQ